jgi:CubicO group peptidase (beta-lactamase class C family)
MQSEGRRSVRLSRRGMFAIAAGMASMRSAFGARPQADSARSRGAWIPPAEFLETLPRLMKIATLPGISMAAIERGVVAWTWTHGVLDAKTREPVRTEHLFEAASISKPVFAYAMLQLVDRRQLELDRPLAEYLRPPYLPDDAHVDRITARHVLSHSSGLPNWGDENQPATLTPAFRPGRYFRYSGEGYFWLQLVAEKLTGKGLDALMREMLFEPAGMTRTMFAWDEQHLPDVAVGHRNGEPVIGHGMRGVMHLVTPRANKWGKPIRDWTHEDWIRVGAELRPDAPPVRVRFQNAAGSLLTTASDYSRFMALLCEGRQRAPWEISEATRRAMLEPQIAVQEDVPFWWGLGWGLEQGRPGLRFAHEGNNDNLFASYAIGDPARGRGLVILTNCGSGSGVLQRVTRAATAFEPLSFIANLAPSREA